MYIIVVYDIGDDNKRKRYADYLKSKGLQRMQRSMFMGKTSPMIIKDIYRLTPRFMDLSNDIVHIIPLTQYSFQHIKVYGKPFTELKEKVFQIV